MSGPPEAEETSQKGGFDHPWLAIAVRLAVIGLAIFVVVWLAAGWVIEIG